MSDPKQPEPVKKTEPKEWHPQQAKLLKGWAEIASSYRWMHNQAYMIYKKKNLWFMLPLIVMSTVTGTANFAQTTFPESIRPYVPQIIGAINLISAIMTTIYQFLKISEFMESHRISSINYGKLARTITIELNLPVKDRNSGGAECVKTARTEIDRLIEQSPAIPKHVLIDYEHQFAGRGLSEPEIIVINKVDIYEDKENKIAETVSEAGLKFKNALLKTKKPLFTIKSSESPTEKRKENLNQELNNLGSSKLVSSINTSTVPSILTGVLNKFSKPSPKLPVFTPIPEPFVDTEKTQFVFTEPKEEVLVEDIETGKLDLNDTVDTIVDNLVKDTIVSSEGVSNDLELLRSSRLVSSKK
jgi:hypothetical protein